MSILDKLTPGQIDAYYAGLREFRDTPEAGEDLGAPMDPRQLASNLQSAAAARAAASDSERLAARTADLDYYEKEFHLTGAEPLSPAQQVTNKAGHTAVTEALQNGHSEG